MLKANNANNIISFANNITWGDNILLSANSSIIALSNSRDAQFAITCAKA